jgi:hypothetical protein
MITTIFGVRLISCDAGDEHQSERGVFRIFCGWPPANLKYV